MIKICLIFKIHIPAVRALNEFLKTDTYLQNNNNSEIEKSIVEKYASNLLSYLCGLENVYIQSGRKFKAGLSVNGITLNNLMKYAPEVVEQLKKMLKSGCVEILSEPWSHSIVPFFDEHTLIRQIKLHDDAVQSIFGIVPEIFIVNTPDYLPHFLKTVSIMGKKAVFTNLNQLDIDVYNKNVLENTNNPNHVTVLPINHKISRMLQKLDFNAYTDENSNFSKRIVSEFQNYVTGNNPVIAVYNLTQANNLFHFSKTFTWQKFLQDLLTENKIHFTSPSESVEKYKSENNTNNFNSILYFSKLEDVWLENKFQIQAFDRQLRINTLMHDDLAKELEDEWDILQDMENLFYMNSRFNKRKYARHHFNLFDDPDTAFYSYMSVLGNFMDKVLEKVKMDYSFRKMV